MDDQNNRIPEIDNEGSHGEASEKPSGICDHDSISANVKCEEDTSSQDSQSKPTPGNSSQTVDVMEISSDDELQIVEVSLTESVKKAAPGHGTDHDQNPSSSTTTTSGRTSPKDITCSVCLSEYENKAFLDNCFRILAACICSLASCVMLAFTKLLLILRFRLFKGRIVRI